MFTNRQQAAILLLEKIAKYESPPTSRSGHLLPSLRRERNPFRVNLQGEPSEAENSSRSSPSLRSGFSAKGDNKSLFVFAIPRGAVVMGKIIADKLRASLDILVVRKIGAPNNPELAIGAVGPSKTVYWDQRLCRALHVRKDTKELELSVKSQEREEREVLLRGKKSYPRLQGKVVLVVDDGVATGATSIVAGKFFQKKKVGRSILATPVIAKDTLLKVRQYFDEVIYLDAPWEFGAVGQFYQEFPQVSDEEVIKLLSN